MSHLHHAQRIRRQTPLRLKTVAEIAGFNNANYLNAAFKRETDQTPEEYWKQQNGG
jgi:AraC-like DNA-binding protein